jgi:hypothetical protein
VSDQPRSIGFGRAALHLGGLWALAFAQPLFDLLGRNAEFFVARGSTRGDILVLAFGYALVPPLAGAAIVWGLGRIRPVAGWAAHLVFVATLVGALVLPPLGDTLGGSALTIVVAAAVGGGAAALYARSNAVRTFATVLSPAPLVVLVLFLAFSPVSELVRPGEEEGETVAGPVRSSVPIVHIVLDELPESTLAGADGRIDAQLFPNLARFARDATWYRNATTVDDLTTEAVPAQLTGMKPHEGSLPTVRDHPRSLFTLFARSHDLTVIEPITDLCPERLCSEERPGTLDRWRALESDLRVVVGHLLAPDDLRENLPPIDRVWEGFEGGATPRGELRGGSNLKHDVLARLAKDDATVGFQRATAALDRPRSRPPLIFVHSTLPHGAWRFLPDGREYPMRRGAFPGLESVGWTGPQWVVDQGFQRHILQVQYTDRLVGELLDKLRAAGLYDDAVIVVAADHGVAFRTGQPRRPANRRNQQDIAGVPLLVKLPAQRSGRVDERAVRTVDVLPTIAQATGVRVPWRTDGMPAGRRKVDPAARIDVTHAGVPALSTSLGAILRARREREAVETALLRDGVYAMGPAPQLIGRRVTAAPRRVASGARATVDAPQELRALDHESAVLPAYVSGAVDGLPADALLAVAVNGRVEATTRVLRTDDGSVYAAIVPPSSLRDGANTVMVLEVLPGDRLRPIGAAP